MKNTKHLIFPLLAVFFFGVLSCTSMNDYLNYTNGKEIVYSGKVDSVLMHSGKERVVFYGLLISDPKVSHVKIYWNNRTDSLVIPIVRSAGIDTIRYSIPLSEGSYKFEILTNDQDGNESVVVNASGYSYGAVYQGSLYNRLYKSAKRSGTDVTLDWYTAEDSSPFVDVKYTDSSDQEHVVKVLAKATTTILKNFKKGTSFRVQTYFLPDKAAVDTFKTEDLVSAIIN